jgi:hypothetical protein
VNIAPLIDRRSRIFGAITIYNWLTVLAIALQFPLSLAIYYGLDLQWGGILSDLVLCFVTAIEFFAFQRLLELRVGLTIALVAVDFVLSRILELLTYGLVNNALF